MKHVYTRKNVHRIKVIVCWGIIYKKKSYGFSVVGIVAVVQPCHSSYLVIYRGSMSGSSLVNISSLYNNLNMYSISWYCHFFGVWLLYMYGCFFFQCVSPLYRSFVPSFMRLCVGVWVNVLCMCGNMQLFYNGWMWRSNNYICTSLSLSILILFRFTLVAPSLHHLRVNYYLNRICIYTYTTLVLLLKYSPCNSHIVSSIKNDDGGNNDDVGVIHIKLRWAKERKLAS